MSHSFRVTNGGKGVLELTDAGTTCSCTISELDGIALQPGESTDITLNWVGTHTSSFSHHATIQTNDPTRPRFELRIVGTVVRKVSLDPPVLIFSSVTSGQTATAHTRLLAYLDKTPQVQEHRILDRDLAEYFDVQSEPLAPKECRQQRVQGGLLLTVTLLPGIPEGRFNTQLELVTNLTERAIEVPISGIVYGDLTIVGFGWQADTQTVDFGEIPFGKGARRGLSLLLRGQSPDTLTVELRSVRPQFLQIKLGEKKELSGKNLVTVPLEIIVPRNCPATNHLGVDSGGLGEIVLTTGHPRVPEVRLSVKFAVVP